MLSSNCLYYCRKSPIYRFDYNEIGAEELIGVITKEEVLSIHLYTNTIMIEIKNENKFYTTWFTCVYGLRLMGWLWDLGDDMAEVICEYLERKCIDKNDMELWYTAKVLGNAIS